MRKSRKDSRIEIWSANYINNQGNGRNNEDIDAVILQIEAGNSDDYIVEVVDEKDF